MDARKLLDSFTKQPITETILSLGTGGLITLTADDPNLDRGCTITFTAEADVNNVKMNTEGRLQVIATIKRDTFSITEVEAAPPVPEQMELGADASSEVPDGLAALDGAFGDVPDHQFVASAVPPGDDADPFCVECGLAKPSPVHVAPEKPSARQKRREKKAAPAGGDEAA